MYFISLMLAFLFADARIKIVKYNANFVASEQGS